MVYIDYLRLRFGGVQPLCGMGVHSINLVTATPAFTKPLTAPLRAAPAPFSRTSASVIPRANYYTIIMSYAIIAYQLI